MGNVHSVTGIRPCPSVEGTILPVRRGEEEAFELHLRTEPVPSYIGSARQVPSIDVGNPNVFSNTVPDPERAAHYLVIRGGGKWGYDQEFMEYLEAIAPMLEDALFLLSDEYVGYVDSYEIRDGVLRIERVVEEQGEALEHARVLTADQPERLFEFDRQEAAQWVAARDSMEALPWIDRALARRPGNVALLGDRVYCLGAQGRHAEALDAAEEVLAALPPHTLQAWGERKQLLEVVDDVAEQVVPVLKRTHEHIGHNQLRLGNYELALQYFMRSHSITPTRGAVGALDGICVTLLRLGRLEDAEERISELLRGASSRHSIARAYYHRACLRALREDVPGAVRDVGIVLELQPRWRSELAQHEALAPLREHPDLDTLMSDSSGS